MREEKKKKVERRWECRPFGISQKNKTCKSNKNTF